MKMTKAERELFRQQVIAEYKKKYEKQQSKKKPIHYIFLSRLRKMLPLNIIVGLVACVILVYVNGWRMLGYLFLSGIIWLTLITSLVTALFSRKQN